MNEETLIKIRLLEKDINRLLDDERKLQSEALRIADRLAAVRNLRREYQDKLEQTIEGK